MRKLAFGLLTGMAVAGLAGGALAQQQQPAVPEQMPFDIPYGEPITLEHAQKVLAAAEGEAKKHNWKMDIAVVTPSGDLKAFARMDGAQLGSIEISQDKARSSARFRRPTKVFMDTVESGHPFIMGLRGIVPSEGGIPLVENGKLIGAIGCSGGTSAQDGVACKAGADLVK